MSRRLSLVGVSAFVLTLSLPYGAVAQERRQFEAFGSFSYLIADVGGSDFTDVSGPGFAGEFAFFLNDWFGLGAEVGYNAGDLGLPEFAIIALPEISFSQWTIMFGPRFRFAETEHFRVGAQAMAGIARANLDVDFDIEELSMMLPGPGQGPGRFGSRAFDIEVDRTVFGASFGVHFDLKIKDRLTWRVVQPDVLVTNYGDSVQAHFRIASGLGFEF